MCEPSKPGDNETDNDECAKPSQVVPLTSHTPGVPSHQAEADAAGTYYRDVTKYRYGTTYQIAYDKGLEVLVHVECQ